MHQIETIHFETFLAINGSQFPKIPRTPSLDDQNCTSDVLMTFWVQAEIKAQTKTVLKMASIHEAELEVPDAKDIAKEDVILRKMEEEKHK